VARVNGGASSKWATVGYLPQGTHGSTDTSDDEPQRRNAIGRTEPPVGMHSTSTLQPNASRVASLSPDVRVAPIGIDSIAETPEGRNSRLRYHRTASCSRFSFAAVLGSAMASLDVTVVNIALPAVGNDLHARFDGLQWTITGYTVTLARR
jgi:hypothetical protein